HNSGNERPAQPPRTGLEGAVVGHGLWPVLAFGPFRMRLSPQAAAPDYSRLVAIGDGAHQSRARGIRRAHAKQKGGPLPDRPFVFQQSLKRSEANANPEADAPQ